MKNGTRQHLSGFFQLMATALALVMCLSFCLPALGEAGTVFPWRNYWLDVALVTADPDEVAVEDAPDNGVMVMVKLVPDLGTGTIKADDIFDNSDDFDFRDRDGDEYKAYSVRVRGVAYTQEAGFSTKPEQESFELLFFLEGKTEEALQGAKLLAPGESEKSRVIVSLDKAPHTTAGTDAGMAAPAADTDGSSTTSFLLGGIRYTVSALEDEPSFQMPNRMDGKEGHTVAFSYAETGAEAEAANKLLYSGARLKQPNGDLVRAYSNMDNLGNPYVLYFGLSGDVLLTDCVFTVAGDEGDAEIPLTDVGAAPATPAEPTVEPEPEPTEEPEPVEETEPTEEPEPDEEPAPQKGEGAFSYTVGGVTYDLEMVDVAYDKEEKQMAVEIILYDHELLDFVANKKLNMPFGCGIISTKDGFQYTEGVTASISTPMHMTFYFDTKTIPELVCFGKLNEGDYKASEDFALVDSDTLAYVATFPLTALMENEKDPAAIVGGAAMAEPAAEPEATAKPAQTDVAGKQSAAPATAVAISENAGEDEQKVVDTLTQCAADVKDEWQLAVYRAGIQNLKTESDGEQTTYTFLLRGFDPGLKELGKYNDESKADYLAKALENARQYNVEASLVMEDGAFTPKSVKALKAAVKKAASASMKAFKDKRILNAICDELFYSDFPTKNVTAQDVVMTSPDYLAWTVNRMERLSDLSAQQRTAFFLSRTKQTLDVTGGPFAMTLNCTGVNLPDLFEAAREDALNELKYMEYDDRWANDQTEYEFLLALADNALTMKKKGKEACAISLNVDGEPFYGDEYAALLAQFTYDDELSGLKDDVGELPDYPAKQMPSVGRLSGVNSGTQVRIKAPKDSAAYYIQMRNYHNDEVVVTGFVQPGKTCNLRIPRGDYYAVMASGKTWYGEEYLFGDETRIRKTGLIDIPGSNYITTLTLEVPKGNIDVFGADEGDLQK